MVQTPERPGAAFKENYVDADGFHIRYLEAGHGDPVVTLHGGGGVMLSRADDLLSRQFRIIAFETPGFGKSPENTRTQSLAELARTMAAAAGALGLERYSLMGTSFGGSLAAWLAVQFPERLDALVLVAPAAIRPEAQTRPPTGSPEEIARRLVVHPENLPPPETDPRVIANQRALTQRLMGPPRDAELENKLRELEVPTLVAFGTRDAIIPPEMGRIYREIMPNCNLVYVYDAGHEAGFDRPEALAGVVGDFLERHETFIVSRKITMINP